MLLLALGYVSPVLMPGEELRQTFNNARFPVTPEGAAPQALGSWVDGLQVSYPQTMALGRACKAFVLLQVHFWVRVYLAFSKG